MKVKWRVMNESCLQEMKGKVFKSNLKGEPVKSKTLLVTVHLLWNVKPYS